MSFSAEFATFFLVFILSVILQSKQKDNKSACRLQIVDYFVYTVLWIAFLFRLCLTSYMNVKQSQTKSSANRQFLMVFNQDEQEVGRAVQENEEREKAQRRDKFYKEYADMQLSRIITSFLDENVNINDSASYLSRPMQEWHEENFGNKT